MFAILLCVLAAQAAAAQATVTTDASDRLLRAAFLKPHRYRRLQGESSHSDDNNELVQLWANKVGPFSNPSETYSYYDLPFCQPADGVKYKTLTHVGEVIDSNRDANTAYNLPFRADKLNTLLCSKQLTVDEVDKFRKAVAEDYYIQMYYDDLPMYGFVGKTEKILHATSADLRYYLFTHNHFEVHYNGNNIIQVTMTTDATQAVDVSEDVLPDNASGLPVEFTYSVQWHETPVVFSKRLEHFDALSRNPIHLEIHWFSIVNSILSVLLLTAILITIFMRTLKHDFARFTTDDPPLDDDECGWKYIHADVFRFPRHKSFFCSLIGAGSQLLSLCAAIFALALAGVFYPYNRGLLYTAQIVLYAMTAGISGYTSAHLFRQMGGDRWARHLLLTCVIFAGPFFLMFCVLNTVAISYRSIAALPAGTIFVVLFSWTVVTVPLTVFMGITGKNSAGEFYAPCRTNKYPREIPDLPWYRSAAAQMALAGFLPFSAIYVELYYIFASVWGHKVFIIWSILAIVVSILLVTVAFITVALVYFQLALEDHRWWWRSFLCGGSTGLWVYAYSVYYYFFRSRMTGLLQTSFFFGYMAVACYGLFIMLGTVGFRASLAFVRRIYYTIKAE